MLVTLLSPHTGALARPSTPKCCELGNVSPTPCSFVVFTSYSHLNLSRSLGACQDMRSNKQTIVITLCSIMQKELLSKHVRHISMVTLTG